MTPAVSRQVLTRDGDMVDAIAVLAYGRSAGVTEALLAANPVLLGLGPVLPAGVELFLPALPAATTTAPTIKLWD